MADLFETRIESFDAVGFRTDLAELVVIPALGARIVSLKSRRTGREWCWRRPGSPFLWTSGDGDPFTEGPQAGVDECLPSVRACRVGQIAAPDHGEVWSAAWTLDRPAAGRSVIATSVSLKHAPFDFTRTIRATRYGFTVDYVLQNRSAATQPFIWSLHPLLALEAEDRIELPDSVRSLRVDNSDPTGSARKGDVWTYPIEERARLDRIELPNSAGGCAKLFAGPLDQGRASVTNAMSGERLTFSWDAGFLPYLGIWINRGCDGHQHLALEPTNGSMDSLAEGVRSGHGFGVLPPLSRAVWRVAIEIARAR
jgi:galactose mutarotase-like enzyme